MRSMLCLALLACACGSGEPSPRHPPPAPVQTVDGEVLRVSSDSPDSALASGLSIVVRPSGHEPVQVRLAPGWYLDERGLRFQPGDRVHVSGSVSSGVFVASHVEKSGKAVPLRDASGEPLWKKKSPAP